MAAKTPLMEMTGTMSKTDRINLFTAAIIESYLEYAGKIVHGAMTQQGYSPTFSEINDELIIKPDELIELIDKVQRALASAD